MPDLQPEAVWYNEDPRKNFFRVEETVNGDISFVDGLGCNTGYFKLANLLQDSTTAAHEFGHTLGLPHPAKPDLRGSKTIGIMYPRGTLADPEFQYDPNAEPGAYGGFLDPRHRRVRKRDIKDLKIRKYHFDKQGHAVLGAFTNIYHSKQEPLQARTVLQ